MLFIVGEFRIRSARRGVTIEVLSFWFMLFDGHDGAHQLSGGEHDDIIMMGAWCVVPFIRKLVAGMVSEMIMQ